MLLNLQKLILNHRKTFLRFCSVGLLGFVVDVAVLYLMLYVTDLDKFQARFVSFPVALMVTWISNRIFSFSSKDSRFISQFGRYITVQLAGVAVNIGVYSLALIVVPAMPPFLALCFGSGVALGVNYIGLSCFVFKR